MSLAYIPNLSASGSVANTISASTFFANFKANSNAFLSSGFGYVTVEKFPSGSSCSETTYTFSKPISFNILCTGKFPVPWSGVYTIFIFFCTFLIISSFSTNFLSSEIYASSTSFPISLYRPFSVASFIFMSFISEKSVTFLTSFIISLSTGETICAPSSQYTLYPLYSAGL